MAVMSASVAAGLAVAGSSGATTSDDTIAETSITTTPESVADTTAASSAETAAVEILPPEESWGGLTRGEWDARVFQWTISTPKDVNPFFAPR